MLTETNFDGLVGPTHSYSGLSPGNVLSERHAGDVANPRAAALQGLDKMRLLADLGVFQAVLPPQPRPDVDALRRLGFRGDDPSVLAEALRGDAHLLRVCGSASSMWTANAATVAPSADTADGRVHLTVANLSAMFHRSLEAPVTAAVLRAIFRDETRFSVHDALPAGTHFSDEGAANHTRLCTPAGTVHLFAYGRSGFDVRAEARRYPRRQTREASEAVARLNALDHGQVLTWRQHPAGIDAGAFHTDVLAVGNEGFLLLHELAFADHGALINELRRRLGSTFETCMATSRELPVDRAVGAYPFNSQLVTLAGGAMAIVAPAESRADSHARRFLDRVVAENNPVERVHYVDVNASMNNGGGPACLRLRVALTDEERAGITGRVLFDDALESDLRRWIERHYRDRLAGDDLADPELLDEVRTALDELTRLLELGSVYAFQR